MTPYVKLVRANLFANAVKLFISFYMQPICVKDILLDLQSCELMRDSTFRCEAAVIITLDSRNCVDARGSPLFPD